MFEPQQARVLVVDDEAPIRLTLEAILQRVGYTVTTAANGEEALAWLMEHRFDLLLLDLRLTGNKRTGSRKTCPRISAVRCGFDPHRQ